MALLSAQDEAVLRQHLSVLTRPVSLVLFTQTFGGSEAGGVARRVLNEVARLNDRISVVEKNFVLDVDDRARYGIDRSPAIVVLGDGQDTRIRFCGAPTGYEFVALIEAVVLAGTGTIDLQPETLARLAAVTTPTSIQVFSTPT
jgi:alkyl hydroperoxide reductase subunit AhpF